MPHRATKQDSLCSNIVTIKGNRNLNLLWITLGTPHLKVVLGVTFTFRCRRSSAPRLAVCQAAGRLSLSRHGNRNAHRRLPDLPLTVHRLAQLAASPAAAVHPLAVTGGRPSGLQHRFGPLQGAAGLQAPQASERSLLGERLRLLLLWRLLLWLLLLWLLSGVLQQVLHWPAVY